MKTIKYIFTALLFLVVFWLLPVGFEFEQENADLRGYQRGLTLISLRHCERPVGSEAISASCLTKSDFVRFGIRWQEAEAGTFAPT